MSRISNTAFRTSFLGSLLYEEKLLPVFHFIDEESLDIQKNLDSPLIRPRVSVHDFNLIFHPREQISA
jgi:hypothetical protein